MLCNKLDDFVNVGNVVDRQSFLSDMFWSTAGSSMVAGVSEPSSLVPSETTDMAQTVEKLCRNGALMGESAVPGAYSSACMGLSERSVPLPKYQKRNGIDTERDMRLESGAITIQQKSGGSGNTGMTVWNSGLLLTRLLDGIVDELYQKQGDNYFWGNQDIIELGCGTGLCSIAAHRLGAKSVLATDGNPGVIELAKTNIRKNCYHDTNESIESGSRSDVSLSGKAASRTIRAENLQWGFLDAMDYSDSASFIIGADLTYNPGSWRVLAETIATVLKTKNENIEETANFSNQCYALYLSVGHDGFNVNAEMDGFLSVAKEVGLVNLMDGVEGIDPSQVLLRTLSDAERKILAQGGGFRVAVLGRKSMRRL